MGKLLSVGAAQLRMMGQRDVLPNLESKMKTVQLELKS